jgi:hypothetical protein
MSDQDREMRMGETDVGAYRAYRDPDPDPRERQYQIDSGIGGMEKFLAPPKAKQNVKTGQVETSTYAMTAEDALYIRQSLDIPR